MTKHRWWARLKALWLGYFWLPCPVCGEFFAGFEASTEAHRQVTYAHGRCVCSKPNCVTEARRLSDEFWRSADVPIRPSHLVDWT